MSLVQPYHRALAESTMTATVALRKPDTRPAINETTGKYANADATPYATPACRIMLFGQTQGHLSNAGDASTLQADYIVAVPIDTDAIEVGDIGLVSNADGLLDGREVRVAEILFGSLLVERRLRCTVQT